MQEVVMSGFIKVVGSKQLSASQNLPLIPLCRECRYFRNGDRSQVCTHPNHPSGLAEPLFYAVLKCGPKRDWFEGVVL